MEGDDRFVLGNQHGSPPEYNARPFSCADIKTRRSMETNKYATNPLTRLITVRKLKPRGAEGCRSTYYWPAVHAVRRSLARLAAPGRPPRACISDVRAIEQDSTASASARYDDLSTQGDGGTGARRVPERPVGTLSCFFDATG